MGTLKKHAQNLVEPPMGSMANRNSPTSPTMVNMMHRNLKFRSCMGTSDILSCDLKSFEEKDEFTVPTKSNMRCLSEKDEVTLPAKSSISECSTADFEDPNIHCDVASLESAEHDVFIVSEFDETVQCKMPSSLS